MSAFEMIIKELFNNCKNNKELQDLTNQLVNLIEKMKMQNKK